MKRTMWIDLLRILSIFLVIVIHVVCLNWYSENPRSLNWNILNVYDGIARFSVPVFFMISGALFLSKDKIDIKKLYTKNILKIMICLIVWSFIYVFISRPELLTNISLENIYQGILKFNDSHYHLWFLFSLIGLYMVTPVLKKVVENKELLNYLLIISIIFSIVLPTFNSTVSYLNSIVDFGAYINLYYSITNWLTKIDIPYVCGYLTMFLTGYKLYTEDVKKPKVFYALGIISLLITILGTSFISVKLNVVTPAFYGYNTLNVYLTSVAVFIFFKNVISKIKIKPYFEKLISNLAKYSFGIYLVHDIFLIYLVRYNLYPLNLNLLISVPIYSLIVFFCSLILVYIISKIPILNKYII